MLLVEHLGHQAHRFVNSEGLAVGGGDAGALLAAVLEGEETEKGETGRVLAWGINAHHATLFVKALASYQGPKGTGLSVHIIILAHAGPFLHRRRY